MSSENFDTLSKILFDGEVRAWDIKTMPGTEQNVDQEELSAALLESMQRMGLVSNSLLVDKNNQS